MLYSRRKRLADLAGREAAGESFWTDKFDESARTRIALAFRNSASNFPLYPAHARETILHDEGRLFLVNHQLAPDADLLTYLMRCDDETVPTVIEAMSLACNDSRLNHSTGNWRRTATFDDKVNVILREHRISYELTKGRMVPFSTKELHEAVVAPSLRLLAGHLNLEKVESAYQAALEEITNGKAANAITDAGTALQEMLAALGCEGNALGPQIASARGKGILAPHDSPMLTAFEKVLHWVSADRSEKGDAHSVTSPTLDDAWFTVHIVGAIIVRLSKPVVRVTE